jgi:Cu/Ag efflux protein CusF
MMPISILIAASILGAGLALQAGADDSHKHHAASEAKSVAAGAASTEGEVRKIDKGAGTLTIKHGPMPQFDMPAMTMVYRVKDKTMFDRLKPGNRIRFDVAGADGTYTLTRLEKLK